MIQSTDTNYTVSVRSHSQYSHCPRRRDAGPVPDAGTPLPVPAAAGPPASRRPGTRPRRRAACPTQSVATGHTVPRPRPAPAAPPARPRRPGPNCRNRARRGTIPAPRPPPAGPGPGPPRPGARGRATPAGPAAGRQAAAAGPTGRRPGAPAAGTVSSHSTLVRSSAGGQSDDPRATRLITTTGFIIRSAARTVSVTPLVAPPRRSIRMMAYVHSTLKVSDQ